MAPKQHEELFYSLELRSRRVYKLIRSQSLSLKTDTFILAPNIWPDVTTFQKNALPKDTACSKSMQMHSAINLIAETAAPVKMTSSVVRMI